MVKQVIKNKRKKKKLQYLLTVKQLLKSGFHLGGDQQFARKDMNPFIIGKSKARVRFKMGTKKIIKKGYFNIGPSVSLEPNSKNLRNKNLWKGFKQKRLAQLFTQIKRGK